MSDWIKVSDRIPEQNETVLLSIWGSDYIVLKDNETLEKAADRVHKECRYVTLGFLGSDGWYGPDWYPLMVEPVAWMRLPEVYDGDRAVEVLSKVPTVDAVEVVRCKDCKHFTEPCYPRNSWGACSVWDEYAKPDDYCSYTERRTS